MQAKAGVTGVLQLPKAAEQGSMGLTSSVCSHKIVCHGRACVTLRRRSQQQAHMAKRPTGVSLPVSVAVSTNRAFSLQHRLLGITTCVQDAACNALSKNLHAGVPPDPGSPLLPLQHRAALPSA